MASRPRAASPWRVMRRRLWRAASSRASRRFWACPTRHRRRNWPAEIHNGALFAGEYGGQERQSAMVAAKDFTGLTSDSRKVEAGYLFAALPGSKTDGARFLSDAVARGARAVLARPEMAADAAALGVAFIADENPRLRLAPLPA